MHTLLEAISSSNQSYQQIVELIDFCHKSALAYLKAKMARGRFDINKFGIRLEDYALDAIAELFAKDEHDRFEVLCRYLRSMEDIRNMPPDDVEGAMRRLVFSAVNQHVFRSMGEFDSGLAKIIRNCKVNLRNHPVATLQEHRGTQMVSPRRATDLLLTHPFMPPEFLELELRTRVPPCSSVPEILTALVQSLKEQKSYARMVPLIQLSLTIRTMYGSEVSLPSSEIPDDGLSRQEIETMIAEIVKVVGERHGRPYMDRGRLSAYEMQAHIHALQSVLTETCFDGREGLSFFEMLRQSLPNVTREEYRSRHRVVFEYLVRLAKAELKEMALKEL